MYNHLLHLRKKYFCRYCLQTFSTEKILKRYIKDCVNINGKQRNTMSKRSEYVKFKNYETKIKSQFIVYADFESISEPEDNGKQNPKESYTKNYQKYIACSYSYKLICADDKFSKPFKTYLGKDAVYIFINNMIEKSKYCSNLIKKLFNKELVMIKDNNEDFEKSTKF